MLKDRLIPTLLGIVILILVNDLAHAYLKMGQADVAITVLEAAAKYPGARTEALRALIAVNLESGDSDAAKRWARVACAENPQVAEDPRIKEILGESPAQSGAPVTSAKRR